MSNGPLLVAKNHAPRTSFETSEDFEHGVLVAKSSEIERRQLTESLVWRRLKEEKKNVSSYHARRDYCGESFPNTNPAARVLSLIHI